MRQAAHSEEETLKSSSYGAGEDDPAKWSVPLFFSYNMSCRYELALSVMFYLILVSFFFFIKLELM